LSATCQRNFSSHTGLAHHERIVHPATRNEKRANQAKPGTQRSNAKGHDKVWTKPDIDLIIQLELRLAGHSRIAKEMVEHFPDKAITHQKQTKGSLIQKPPPNASGWPDECHQTPNGYRERRKGEQFFCGKYNTRAQNSDEAT